MPARPNRRRNEYLDMGSETVTISRDLLFVTMRRAIKEALLDGKKIKQNEPDEVTHANAQGRASHFVNELLHKGGTPEPL